MCKVEQYNEKENLIVEKTSLVKDLLYEEAEEMMEGGEGNPDKIMEVLQGTENVKARMEVVSAEAAEHAEAARTSDLDLSDVVCKLLPSPYLTSSNPKHQVAG